MAKKKTYYIPTIETITLEPGVLMQDWLAGSGDHGSMGLAPRRDPAF